MKSYMGHTKQEKAPYDIHRSSAITDIDQS